MGTYLVRFFECDHCQAGADATVEAGTRTIAEQVAELNRVGGTWRVRGTKAYCSDVCDPTTAEGQERCEGSGSEGRFLDAARGTCDACGSFRIPLEAGRFVEHTRAGTILLVLPTTGASH